MSTEEVEKPVSAAVRLFAGSCWRSAELTSVRAAKGPEGVSHAA